MYGKGKGNYGKKGYDSATWDGAWGGDSSYGGKGKGWSNKDSFGKGKGYGGKGSWDKGGGDEDWEGQGGGPLQYTTRIQSRYQFPSKILRNSVGKGGSSFVQDDMKKPLTDG